MYTIVEANVLCDEEQELIRAAAANHGSLEVAIRSCTRGRAVWAGRKSFFDPADRCVSERYISLLAHLQQLELIREAGANRCYELTNFGWELSRRLTR